ncbi:MAG: hypothetical protein HY342_07000 [Candidatus Lambdaproteobacteria bacterium]|nr:hypothetical protein [Candidatus Lambdaproteobacteria bacterium]
MICYLCGARIPDDQPFYNDYEKYVCKPCFLDAPRCFVCRFPGRELGQVEGLGAECEFCRGNIIAEGMVLAPLLDPLRPFLASFGLRGDAQPSVAWDERLTLRELQTGADLPPMQFIDDFLQFCYPVFYREGTLHLLRRMSKATLVVYGLIALASAEIAAEMGHPHLAGRNEARSFARGWCHWIGAQAAERLGYALEARRLRKWPELGGQGDFERWVAMARFNKPPKMVRFFRANLQALLRKSARDDEETRVAT